MPRAALSAAWEASPTFRRLVDVDQLQAAPLAELAAAVERDYLATVTGLRNPHHIWAWAVNRHGLANTVLGWLIACDTPPSADRPERNPGGWFTRFATAEQPWRPRPEPSQAWRGRQAASPRRRWPSRRHLPTQPSKTDEPAALNPEAAAAALAAYRSAWVQTLTQRIGSFRAESIWKSWLSQAAVTGVEDDRLQIRVRGRPRQATCMRNTTTSAASPLRPSATKGRISSAEHRPDDRCGITAASGRWGPRASPFSPPKRLPPSFLRARGAPCSRVPAKPHLPSTTARAAPGSMLEQHASPND